jgi:hypothetical protein
MGGANRLTASYDDGFFLSRRQRVRSEPTLKAREKKPSELSRWPPPSPTIPAAFK